MHLTSAPVAWYVIRASGVVAYVLLSMGAVVGITLAGKARLPRWPRFAVEDVHRFIGLLVGVFVVIHVLTIAIDSFLPFSIGGIAIPLTASYRPIWTAMGIVSAELLLALAITNRLRRRLPYRVWRSAHYVNFPVWLLATLHGLGSGTDRHTLWLLGLELGSVVAVLVALAWRVGRHFPGVASRRLAAGAALAGIAVVLVASELPTGGSGHHRTAQPPATHAGSFADDFSGRIDRREGPGTQLVSLSGEGTGSKHVLVRFDLLAGNGRLAGSELQLRYADGGATCVGSVSQLQARAVGGECKFADGSTVTVRASWGASGTDTVQGELDVT
jgi:methionine sulfoxide reductase heme-binding subunit